ncbi:cell division protein FtsK [Streptomyces nigrescens]|uniref:cell division protein FtsK n=1 Tax=Streptomyces nigrescens TaxID=1920 RepID=UPI0036F78CD6
MTKQTAMPIQALRSSVRLADPHTLAALDASATPLLGLADGDRPICLAEGAEHVLVAAGAGGGVTTLLRSLTAQALCLGAEVDVIDPSGSAHRWAHELPRVTYLSDIAAIHDHLQLTVASLHDGIRSWSSGWHDRRVMVIENSGAVAYGLRQYWMHTRPETQLEEAPGVEALAILLASGPAFGIQIFAGNPRGDIPGLGQVPAREVFPTRVLAYGGATLWQRVAPEVWSIPPYSVIPGRMHVVADHTVTAMQALYLSDDEAHAFAHGTVAGGEAA